MRRFGTLALASLFLVPAAFASDSDTHSVTVTVETIDELAVTGDVTLTINSSDALSDSDSSSTIDWSTNQSDRKITVETNLTEPTFSLSVSATGATGGTGATDVLLSATPQDIVTALAAGSGGATLNYTATAELSDGSDSEMHTVTYTVAATD